MIGASECIIRFSAKHLSLSPRICLAVNFFWTFDEIRVEGFTCTDGMAWNFG